MKGATAEMQLLRAQVAAAAEKQANGQSEQILLEVCSPDRLCHGLVLAWIRLWGAAELQ